MLGLSLEAFDLVESDDGRLWHQLGRLAASIARAKRAAGIPRGGIVVSGRAELVAIFRLTLSPAWKVLRSLEDLGVVVVQSTKRGTRIALTAFPDAVAWITGKPTNTGTPRTKRQRPEITSAAPEITGDHLAAHKNRHEPAFSGRPVDPPIPPTGGGEPESALPGSAGRPRCACGHSGAFHADGPCVLCPGCRAFAPLAVAS